MNPSSISLRRRLRMAAGGLALITAAGLSTAAAAPASASAGATQTYIVLYKAGASSSGAATAVTKAGGTLVANYSKIGVVVARSDSSGFAGAMNKTAHVDQAVATTRYGTKLRDTSDDGGEAAQIAQATWGDSLSGAQWDMRQIHVPEAHEVTGGSGSVLVGDIDTGLDFTHPDLAPNYDAANSADCSSGAPTPLLPGNDVNGHGTHTAGTIAAAANGRGIVGVAPDVKLAGIKSSNDDGFFFPEMVVCSFVWAAEHGVDVTNNSYFADPYLYNCKNDPVQRAIWNAERRAIGYAQSKGVTVVASQGNDSDDLSHPTQDRTSPDFPPDTAVERDITNACAVVPVEVPGVIGVTATGDLQLKSFYSSYGISTADVAAPGGDSILQVTADAPNGRVLSTYSSASTGCLPSRTVIEDGAVYCYLQGTSMAGPHAAGVAALLASKGVGARSIQAKLQQASNPLPCPDDAIYADFPGFNSELPQHCSGSTAHNSFYGHGEVDALKAVG